MNERTNERTCERMNERTLYFKKLSTTRAARAYPYHKIIVYVAYFLFLFFPHAIYVQVLTLLNPND